jgi:hypothetical protein
MSGQVELKTGCQQAGAILARSLGDLVARHTKADKTGVKAERPNLRMVAKSSFKSLRTWMRQSKRSSAHCDRTGFDHRQLPPTGKFQVATVFELVPAGELSMPNASAVLR